MRSSVTTLSPALAAGTASSAAMYCSPCSDHASAGSLMSMRWYMHFIGSHCQESCCVLTPSCACPALKKMSLSFKASNLAVKSNTRSDCNQQQCMPQMADHAGDCNQVNHAGTHWPLTDLGAEPCQVRCCACQALQLTQQLGGPLQCRLYIVRQAGAQGTYSSIHPPSQPLDATIP